MVIMNEEGFLTDQTIDEWSSKVEDLYVKSLKGKNASSQTVKIGIEEILLRNRDHFSTDAKCRIKCHKYINTLRIVIAVQGEQYNPLIHDYNAFAYDILEKLDVKPSYTYHARNRLNIVSFPVRIPERKNAMLVNIGIAVILAILTKLLASILPGDIGAQYIKPIISALFSKMAFIFSAVATPLVFLAVINGISGLGDVVSFGRVGTKLLRRMLFTYCMAMAIMIGFGAVMGLASVGVSSTATGGMKDVGALVLDMIPNNLIEPFRIDNDLQVIVISIFVGAVMLTLGDRVPHVRSFLSELGHVVNKMMFVVCKFLPLFIYLGISDLILGDRLKNISKVVLILVMTLCGAALVILITCIRTKVITKQPLKTIIAAQIPSLIINLTTSSQVSALPESIKCCKEKYGIDSKLVDFGLPLGIVIYMPNGAIMLGSMAWVLTAMGTGPVAIGTVLKIAFVAMVIAIAAPPIPGSAFAVMPILFSACGTDMSMMPLAVIVASTVGYLLPAMNGFCLQQELLMTAWKTDMVDKSIITEKENT